MINKINCLISLEITLKTEEEKQDFKERFKIELLLSIHKQDSTFVYKTKIIHWYSMDRMKKNEDKTD